MSALFANMIVQQTNMALMLLGKVPHPETGEKYKDLESAKMFIDQLEMIEVKTKGNLDKREDGLLKQSLPHFAWRLLKKSTRRKRIARCLTLADSVPRPPMPQIPPLSPLKRRVPPNQPNRLLPQKRSRASFQIPEGPSSNSVVAAAS